MRRRVLAAMAVVLVVAVAAGSAAWWLLNDPDDAMEAWRVAEHVRFGARTGEMLLESGERLAWAEVGPRETERALLLVHGLRGESTVMLPLAAELAGHGHRVIAIDLPGHGRSSPPAEELTIGRASGIVREAAAALDPGRPPVLVGHSMGGWIVGWTALEDPDSVAAAVLVSSGGMAFEPPPYPVLMPDNEEDARRSLPLLFADPPRTPGIILEIASSRPMTGSLALLRSGLSGHYLLDDLLGGMSVPSLVIWGEQDRLIPPGVGRRLAEALPDARYVGIENTGHMVVWEDPEGVADAIDAFLAAAK